MNQDSLPKIDIEITPKEVITKWIEQFNAGNAEEIPELFHNDAIMHQKVYEP